MTKKRALQYLKYLLLGIALYVIAVDINFLWLFGYSPGFDDLKHPPIAIASELYTADGKLIGKYYRENRVPVKYEELSPVLIKALVATEDVRFYRHMGIDFWAVISSAFSTATGDQRGGSTITQQLVKNMYNTRKKSSQGLLQHIPVIRAVVYKSKEWINAFKVETFYSKKDILTMYLNTVGFGNNTFGIKTACKIYFNTSPDKLRPEQAALLVGMLKGTSLYNPLNHPEKALERRNTVLGQMLKDEVINEKEYNRLKQKPLGLNLNARSSDAEQDSYLRSATKNWLEAWCKENYYDIYEDGLKIYTTIDSRLQQYAEEAMEEKMASLQRRFANYWGDKNPWVDEKGEEIPNYLDKLVERSDTYKALSKKYEGNKDSIQAALNAPKRMRVFSWKETEKDTTFSTYDSLRYYVSLLQTGMITLDPFSGHIKTWIGGINSKYFKFDHVNQSKRQPGSTFKPFVYLTALEKGFCPCDTFVDRPVTINYEENGEKKSWSPQNSDFVFSGRTMTLRWAMGRSCNSITAQVTEKVGWDNVVKTAQRLGITSPLENVPSICLGPSDVSLYEMVRAYGTFLNKGQKTDPILVTKITDRDGNVLATFEPKKEKVLTDEIAWLMLYMFKGGIEEPLGTSQALWEYDLFKNRNEIGGKTGTSSNYVDGWYMGINKDLITGVWVGCDDRNVHFRTSATGEGSKTALPIYGRFMEKVYADPKTNISLGKFPKYEGKIACKYYCPNFLPKVDTTALDSLSADSLVNLLPDNTIIVR